MPGTDPARAVRVVIDEAPDLPFLPLLPARGEQSSALARTAGLLVGLPVDLQPSGWRLVDHPGRDAERIAADLSADLDCLEEVLDGYAGPLVVSALGPLSLAAALEKNRGDLTLADHGARRELAESLAEGLSRHVEGIRRRIPGARPVLHLDDPALAAVLAGAIPTISGFGRLRAVETSEARAALGAVIDAVGVPVLVRPPRTLSTPGDPSAAEARSPAVLAVATDVGLAGLLVDPAAVASVAYEALAELVEGGVDLGLGLVSAEPAAPGGATREADAAAVVLRLWGNLGFPAAELTGRLIVTPVDGLAGENPAAARAVLRRTRAVGRVLAEMLAVQS